MKQPGLAVTAPVLAYDFRRLPLGAMVGRRDSGACTRLFKCGVCGDPGLEAGIFGVVHVQALEGRGHHSRRYLIYCNRGLTITSSKPWVPIITGRRNGRA